MHNMPHRKRQRFQLKSLSTLRYRSFHLLYSYIVVILSGIFMLKIILLLDCPEISTQMQSAALMWEGLTIMSVTA